MKAGYEEVVEVLDAIEGPVYRATKYISPNLVVRATLRRYGKKILSGKRDPIEILLTVGRPNYKERAFIKDCKKAGELFPVKKVQVKA